MKIYYLPVDNFGDKLNLWLWPKLLPDFFDDEGDSLFVGIGSVLDGPIPEAPLKVVLGAGTGYYPQQPVIDLKWEIYGVRGPLTAAALGIDPALAITDGAVLLRLLDRPDNPGHYSVSFMPHWENMDRSSDWVDICGNADIHLIDPRLPVEEVLREIASSRTLLTEAMHGAIVADALRIPWAPIKTTENILEFKWLDWCRSLGMEYKALRLAGIGFDQDERHSRIDTGDVARALKKLSREASPVLSEDDALTSALGRLEEQLERFKADFRSGYFSQANGPHQYKLGRVNRRPYYRPRVYPLAKHLGRRYSCSSIIAIGCENPEGIIALYPEFKLIFLDVRQNINKYRTRYPFCRWSGWGLNSGETAPVEAEILRESVIVWENMIPRLSENGGNILPNLKHLLDYAPAALIVSPEQDAPEDDGVSAGLLQHLRSEGFHVAFAGLTATTRQDLKKKTPLCILENNGLPPIGNAPPDFRVVAIMTAYNEEDIITPSIQRLIGQGIGVYLLDNWSTDSTHRQASEFLGQGLLGLERFPAEGPSKYFNLGNLLQRVEEISQQLDADWFIHHDADEEKESPWENISYRDALYHVDQSGFNCVEHTEIVFHPIDNGFQPGEQLGKYFNHYEFGRRTWNFLRVNAWKNLHRPVSLKETGGHHVQFEGARIYPYKFLIKHYPVRSQVHGVKKVLKERKSRWNPEERARGWHVQYDEMDDYFNFLMNPGALNLFDGRVFYKEYLVERLSGVGLINEDEEQTAAKVAGMPLPESALTQVQADSERLQQGISLKDEVLRQVQANSKRLQQEISLKDEALRQVQADIDRLTSSTIWRVSFPLRIMGSRLKSVYARFYGRLERKT